MQRDSVTSLSAKNSLLNVLVSTSDYFLLDYLIEELLIKRISLDLEQKLSFSPLNKKLT